VQAPYLRDPILLGLAKNSSGVAFGMLFLAVVVLLMIGMLKDVLRHSGQVHDKFSCPLLSIDYGVRLMKEQLEAQEGLGLGDLDFLIGDLDFLIGGLDFLIGGLDFLIGGLGF